MQRLLVAFHDHDVVGVATEQVTGVLALSVQHFVGHYGAVRVGDVVQKRGEARDLVGLFATSTCASGRPPDRVKGRERVGLSTVGSGRAAPALAVHEDGSARAG